MFFCITLFLLSFWDSNDTNVNPYVTGPLFSKTLIIFSIIFFFTVQLENFLFPMNSVTLPLPLHSATESTQFSIFYYNYHFFSVWKLYLIPLYIIYFLDDIRSLILVEGVFEMVYSYICTVVKVSVKWFQHLTFQHVTLSCHKGLLLPFPTWVEIGSLHIDPWNFK